MIAKIFALAAFVAVTQAGYLPYSHGHAPAVHAAPHVVKYVAPTYDNGHHHGHENLADHKYQFNYAVNDPHTGDHKSQHEIRDENGVRGFYKVADADGTLRTVHYTADAHSGFNAVVEKSGTPVHPAPVAVKEVPYAPVHPAPVAVREVAYTPVHQAPVAFREVRYAPHDSYGAPIPEYHPWN